MMDQYCLECHQDAYDGWFHSAHRLSSFNNKAYLTSVRETRKVSLERDGSTQASRWCAGCHDPVPFFSGEFDDPNFDDVHNPAGQAGVTCTVCHVITTVNNTRGNSAYTIEEPQHYPFAFSENPILKWVNLTLVKAKPEMHKKTFLKPIVKSAEFCSVCHKVGLPYAVNHYKDFVRGQDHYNSYLLSGVSGHGARSFYYPPVAKSNRNECHMDLLASNDFGARDFDGKGVRQIHNHLFPGANTALPTFEGDEAAAQAHAKVLKDQKVRVDVFALREGGVIEGKFLGPLRPEVPTLLPGQKYLVEVVVRTLGVGHPLTQGTVDSNEIWVELTARQGDRVLGRSGGIFFFDYDLDGRLDLLSANGHLEPDISKVQASETYEQPIQLFWNSGKAGRNLYVKVGPETAGPDLFRPIVGRGSAYADIDGDGDLDVVIVVNNGPARLFRNDGGNANHWVRLALKGNGKTSNRDAIGAKVELKVGDQTCRRQLFPAKSYLSSVELPLTFGLGKADKVDELHITWPSGKVTTLKDLKANQVLKVAEE